MTTCSPCVILSWRQGLSDPGHAVARQSDFWPEPGALEKEFELLGVPFARREQLLDDGIAVLRATFVSESRDCNTDLDGRIGGLSRHGPAQTPPPLWISGSSKQALQRAAEIGDGWLPSDTGRDDPQEQIAVLRRIAGTSAAMNVWISERSLEPIYLGKPTWDVGSETLHGSADVVAGGFSRSPSWARTTYGSAFVPGRPMSCWLSSRSFGAEVVPLLDPNGQRSAKYEEPPFVEIARMSRLQAQAMETSDDERLWGAVGNDMLLLTTKGRRSGREHKVPLAFWRDKEGSRFSSGLTPGRRCIPIGI